MKILLLGFLVFLVSCSSVYHKQEGWIPEGYSDEKITENEYLVSFQTYRDLGWDEIEHYALYRAAELGKVNGYQQFAALDLKKDEYVETQMNREINWIIPQNNNVGSSPNLTKTVIPAFTSEHTIRTLSFKARYGDDLDDNSFRVDAILADK